MAIFGLIADGLSAARTVIRTIVQPVKNVSGQIGSIIFQINIMLVWAAIVNALWSLISGLREVLRWLGLLPFPPVKAVVKAIRTALARLLDVLRPVKRLVEQLTPQLRIIKTELKSMRKTLKTIIRVLKRIRRKLFLAESLARVLEVQQEFLERILPPEVLVRLRALLARLETLTQTLAVTIAALLVLQVALIPIIAAVEAITRRVDALMQRLRAIKDALQPLHLAVVALQAGLRRLMQNRIIKAILDGLSWLMKQADRLINALLDTLGINALLDRVLKRLTGLDGLIQALERLKSKLLEMQRKLNEIRANLETIVDTLRKIEGVLDDLITILQAIQLPAKFILEVAIPEFAGVILGDAGKTTSEPEDHDPDGIPDDEAFGRELEELDQGVDHVESLLGRLEDESQLELPPDVHEALATALPDEQAENEISDLASGEALVAELDDALGGSVDELRVVLEELDIPRLDSAERGSLKGLFDHFRERNESPSDHDGRDV